MDAAKQAVDKIIGRSGHHTTEVDEDVSPVVTSETIKPHRHEETTTAVDREVHQHHYHTTVQPLIHKEVLPEQHTHQQMPVQEREIVHGDTDKIRAGVDNETAKFRDTSTTHETTHSTSQAPVATGEHVHHHVHERVQPVVHKETVAPEVVHTTVPVHEVHHAQAEHHGISTLPTKTLEEFESIGGKIAGGTHRHEEYEGHPRPYNPEMQLGRSGADVDPMTHDGLHKPHDTSSATGTTGGLSGTSGTTNVSGVAGSTGAALGDRTEGNTASRGLDAAADHASTGHTGSVGEVTGTSGPHAGTSRSVGETTGVSGQRVEPSGSVGEVTGTSGPHAGTSGAVGSYDSARGTGASGVGTEGTTSRGLEDSTTGYSSAGGAATRHDRGETDTSTSTKPHTDTTGDAPADDIQSPRQGKDPNLVEEKESSSNWKGEGTDGSHSAVFGLTPDGHKHDDTAHGHGSLRPAHSKGGVSNTDNATGDTGSRAATGGEVADQMHDPKVAEKGHGGPDMSSTDSKKPGAGAPGGEQGFGKVRAEEHGTEEKVASKLDPTTDADGDGKRGVLD